jgi:ATP-dependent DNA helicase RecG
VARLAARGLTTVSELLSHLPRAYDDLRRLTPIGELAAVEDGVVVVVRGTVVRTHIFPRRFLDVTLEETGAKVRARWFRAPAGMARSYPKGGTVALAGPLRTSEKGERELLHPANVTGAFTAGASGKESGLGIRARYQTIEGVSGRVLEKIIGAAVTRYADLAVDVLPRAVCQRLGLPPLPEALRAVHTPRHDADGAELDALVTGQSPAHRRLALEDLLVLQLGFSSRRARARAAAARACAAPLSRTLARVRRAVPFSLTAEQERAIAEIGADMAATRPMQRLLVGDVGSGKTVVALAAAALAAASGGQTLLMVPTEVLAEQHLRTFTAASSGGARGAAGLADLGLRAAVLTASVPRAQREALLARARAGEIDVLIGTQALLDERVLLPDLRLCIIDEQHRFGVAQRSRLRAGGAGATAAEAPGKPLLPHLLVMSATPIPRSLALAFYGDLDATWLAELPPGRQPAATAVCEGGSQRESAYQELRAAIAAGRQGFVICPAREHSVRDGGVTAVGRHAELRLQLAPARVGLVHGGQGGIHKDRALRDFDRQATDVLVATTVVELGIDVPNATVIIIEEADRFGLAQLHQLRGRVGRGLHRGTCFLCTGASGSVSEAALQRLRRLAETNDGFRIAELDLELRGHGDLFGARQAGLPGLRFGAVAGYLQMLELARAEANRLTAQDPELLHPDHQALRAAIETRWAAGNVFAEEAG